MLITAIELQNVSSACKNKNPSTEWLTWDAPKTKPKNGRNVQHSMITENGLVEKLICASRPKVTDA